MNAILPDNINTNGFPVTLAFSNGGEAYVSEKHGELWRIDGGKNHLITTFDVPRGFIFMEGGFMGIKLDPDFEANGLIYCYHLLKKGDIFMNRVVRINKDGSGHRVLLDDIPGGEYENGGILAFGPDGDLYIGTGHTNKPELSQDTQSLAGKVLRIHPDGTIPTDNPFPNSPIYSYGHRNIFGLAFHPQTKQLYVLEEGPDREDKIIILEKGANYGWASPGKVLMGDDIAKPIKTYTPTITLVQNVFVDGQMYFGSYNEGTVHRITLGSTNFDVVLIDEVVHTTGTPWNVIGVFHAPDGRFYVTKPTGIASFTPTG